MDNESFRIDKENKRFELNHNGTLAYLNYEDKNDVWLLTHTKVPTKIGGRGVAARLVKQSLEYLIDKNIKYKAVCSYIVNFLEKHKNFQI